MEHDAFQSLHGESADLLVCEQAPQQRGGSYRHAQQLVAAAGAGHQHHRPAGHAGGARDQGHQRTVGPATLGRRRNLYAEYLAGTAHTARSPVLGLRLEPEQPIGASAWSDPHGEHLAAARPR